MKSRSHTTVERLEARLQADASAARRDPPPALRARILARVHASPRDAAGPLEKRRPILPWGLGVAAAAALFFSAWLVIDRSGTRNTDSQPDVASIRELLDLQPDSLLASAEDPLLTEAANVWSDAAQVADDFVRGLPTPLRERFAGP